MPRSRWTVAGSRSKTSVRETDGLDAQLGGWVSLVWYVAPHVDVRVDAVRRAFPGDKSIAAGSPGRAGTKVDLYLFQFHFYL